MSWGRQEEDRSEPIVEKHAAKVRDGKDGQFNFLQKVALTIPVSVSPVHQDFLEIKLLGEIGEKLKPVAFGAIHLTPLLPWLDKEGCSISRVRYERLRKAGSIYRQANAHPRRIARAF